MSRYVIRYTSHSTTNGKPVGDVYVTGPHFGADVWSHTHDPNEATQWGTRIEAQAEAFSHYWPGAEVVSADDAPNLSKT